ncbi:ATP synthase F(0) complex subunit C1, mitochondrial, partial [Lemmus lemmus]
EFQTCVASLGHCHSAKLVGAGALTVGVAGSGLDRAGIGAGLSGGIIAYARRPFLKQQLFSDASLGSALSEAAKVFVLFARVRLRGVTKPSLLLLQLRASSGAGVCTELYHLPLNTMFLQAPLQQRERDRERETEKAGETAQRLRALAALPKVLSSIPSNHVVAHNHL